MTLNEIVYSVAGRMNQPLNDLLAAEITFAVKYWSAFLIRQDVEKNGNDPSYIRTIVKTLEKVDKGDTCVVDLGCSILRTVNTVPVPISTKMRAPYISVQLVDFSQPIGYIPFEQLFTLGKGRHLGKRMVYSVNNNKLLLYNNNKLGYVRISLIPFDPLEIINDCTTEIDCINADDEYPLPGHLVQIMIRGMVTGEFALRPVNNHEIEIEHEQDQQTAV